MDEIQKQKIATARKMILDYLREQMEAKNITQQQVADYWGWKRETVNRMLAGRFSPGLDQVLMLCEAVNSYIFVIDKEANEDTAKLMRERWNRAADSN